MPWAIAVAVGASQAADPDPRPLTGQPAASAPASGFGAGGETCFKLASMAWPAGIVGRRAHLARLQLVRAQCIDDASFLAQLGALLLEAGDADQALIWLERALLLDPDNLGARTDHALALSELGQPGALQELAQALRNRTDIPAALRARLYPSDERSSFALPSVRLGRLLRPEWGTLGEISLLAGREGNLDRSPRLNELSLTVPEGPPLVLPVTSQPRSGSAALASAAFQVAYAPQADTIFRTGISLGARRAPSERTTDWQQWHWALSASHTYKGLTAQIDGSLAGFGGPLGEPYRQRRLSVSADAAADQCRLRVAAEAEQRIQSQSQTLDAMASGWFASVQCPLIQAGRWKWSLALRRGSDRPESPDRPGGVQHFEAAGLHLDGSIWNGSQLEFSLRGSRSADEKGYSPLLENNASRRLELRQLAVDLTTPLVKTTQQRLDALLRWQLTWQGSNLPLFEYRANSLYGGLRWVW